MKKYIAAFILSITPLGVSFAQTVTDTVDMPTTSCVTLSQNMTVGSRDSRTNGQVSDLQLFLEQNGYLAFDPTGYFGMQTKRAVQSFQRANNITANGVVGPYTRAAIKKTTCGDVSTSSNDTSTSPNQASTPSQLTSFYPSIVSSGGTITLTGLNFSSTGNQVLMDYSQTGDRWYILNQNTSSDGTSITVTLPLTYPCPTYRNGGVGCPAPSVLTGTHTIAIKNVKGISNSLTFAVGTSNSQPLNASPVTSGDTDNWLTLSSKSCTIDLNKNTCTLYATWKTTGKSAPALVEQTTQDSNLTVSADIISSKASETNGLAVQVGRSSRFVLANNVTMTGQEFIASVQATATCADGLVWDKVKKLCVDGTNYPDLTASAVIPARLILDSDVPLTATITNKGRSSTGSSFQSYIQLARGPGGTGKFEHFGSQYMTFSQATTPTLGAGESATLAPRFGLYMSSDNYVPGTYSVRACADTADAIPEKDETNNCGPWVDVTVAITCAASSTVQWSSCTGSLPERGLSDSENVQNTAPGYTGVSHWMCSPTSGIWTQVNLYQTTCSSNGGVSMSPSSPTVLGASAQCYDISLNMHRGYESSSVTKLQNFLKSSGYLDEVSGFYGDKTVSAVKEYQASKGLPQTGMVYDATRASIKGDSCE